MTKEPVDRSVHAAALQRAAELLGGLEQLADYLVVPLEQLRAWAGGYGRPDDRRFLMVVDLLHESDVKSVLARYAGGTGEGSPA